MTTIKKLLGLSRTDLCLLTVASLLLVVIRLIFLGLPFKFYRQRLMRLCRKKGATPVEGDPRAMKIIWAIEAASRRLPKTSHCLTKAVSAKYLFDFWDYNTDLRIGITRGSKGEFRGHAWLESQGRVLIGGASSLKVYSPFPHFTMNIK